MAPRSSLAKHPPIAGSGWLRSGLTRKFAVGTAAGLMAVSLLFLVVFVALYRIHLEGERRSAVEQVSRLFQTSLENAMLKRDLDGLRDIVRQLGEQPGIAGVMILNPAGEVRFASTPELLGRRFSRDRDEGCTGCHGEVSQPPPQTLFMRDATDRPLLRSVIAVRNKPACTGCHGALDQHPVNGVLVVDYDGAPLLSHARDTTLAFLASGAVVLLVTLSGGWWFMRRFVLRPVAALHGASRALTRGELSTRVEIGGNDELTHLGEAFNAMAESLERSLHRVQEKEEFLQGLVDAVPDGIRVIDERFQIVLSNAAYRRQIGLSSAESKPALCYAQSHHRDEPCPPTLLTCPLQEVLEGSESVKTLHRHRRIGGGTFQVEIHGAPMRIQLDGEPRTLLVESIRDLEEQIRYSHEQRLSELGELAAGLAHEIHNPLASVRMALDMLLRGPDGVSTLAPATEEYLAVVDGEIDKCLEVTRRLLRLSAFPSGQPQLIEVNPTVTDILALVHWEAESRGVGIEQSLAEPSPRVLCSDSDLRMVLLNLVQNAFHAMPQGGHLEVFTRRRDRRAEVEVKDDGVGISPAHLAHIFDPFFSRRADQVRGTGLGLPISRAIVQRFGGQIRVDSHPGEGATFTVTLPDADPPGSNT